MTNHCNGLAFLLCFSMTGMDVHTIIDSISDTMTHEDKDLAKTGELAMHILFETMAIVLGNRLKVLLRPHLLSLFVHEELQPALSCNKSCWMAHYEYTHVSSC